MSYNAKMDAVIEDIAKRLLHLETLKVRNSDRLDFKEQSVWGIKRALEAAYQRGYDHAVEETLETQKKLEEAYSLIRSIDPDICRLDIEEKALYRKICKPE